MLHARGRVLRDVPASIRERRDEVHHPHVLPLAAGHGEQAMRVVAPRELEQRLVGRLRKELEPEFLVAAIVLGLVPAEAPAPRLRWLRREDLLHGWTVWRTIYIGGNAWCAVPARELGTEDSVRFELSVTARNGAGWGATATMLERARSRDEDGVRRGVPPEWERIDLSDLLGLAKRQFGIEPAEHFAHSDSPATAPNVPAAHGAAAAAPVGQKVPAGHAMQSSTLVITASDVSIRVPDGHGSGAPAPSLQ